MSGAGSGGTRRRRLGSKAASKVRSRTWQGKAVAKARLSAMRQVAADVVMGSKETKFAVKTIVSTPLSGTVTQLTSIANGIAQGDTHSARDGDKIQQLGMGLRLQVGTAADRPQSMRLLVVEQKDGAIGSGDLPSSMVGSITPAMKRKYNVLHDHVYELRPYRADGGTPDLFRHEYLIKYFKRNRVLNFHGAGVTDLDNGTIAIWAIRDNLAGGTDVIDVEGETLTYFKEK